MPRVFDFQDFLKARFEEDKVQLFKAQHVVAAEKILQLHQPVLVTWYPTWFCSCCEGQDEPQHHMGMYGVSFDGEKTTEIVNDPGPLMKAGADWPCATLKALAEVYSEHEDYEKWIPGIKQPPPGKRYILQGGPASDGTVRIRTNDPWYYDDDEWTENTSTFSISFREPEKMDGKIVLKVRPLPGGYVYRAATDTIEWDGDAGPWSGPIIAFDIGSMENLPPAEIKF